MSKRFRKLMHSLYKCKYHIVFCPKCRYRILQDELGEYAKQEIYQLLSQRERVGVIELSVQSDQVHLLLWIPSKAAVSEIMGSLKG